MPTARRFGIIAFAKQTGTGTPAAAPTFSMPIVQGGMRPAAELDFLPLDGASMARLGRYKKIANGIGSVTILTHLEAIGLLLYEAMGAQAVSGSNPVLHTFTMNDNYPADALTCWSDIGAVDTYRFTDTYVARLAITGSYGELVMAEMDLVSLTFDHPARPAYTLQPAEPRGKFIGSQMKLEADAAVPVLVTTARSAALEIDRAPELLQTTGLAPSLISPMRNVNFNATALYDSAQQDWDFLEVFHLGASGATGGPDQSVARGSFEWTIGRHPIGTQPRGLKVISNGQNWEYDVERPDADASASPIEMEYGGPVVRPAGGGTEVTVELRNETAGAY
jgi:hypothetical protein